jgi:hypothetical protein
MPPVLAEKSELMNVHEERIQRLEDGVAGTRTDVALLDQKFDTLSANVEALTHKMGEAVDAMKANADKVDGILDKIASYEEARKERRARWASWGKATWAVVGGAVAVFLKELAQSLWKHYAK